MTCTWCNDTKTMKWDETERGTIPPPPVDWLSHERAQNEDWDRDEAICYYKPNDHLNALLNKEPCVLTIPCPVCIGFGRARNSPWDVELESAIQGKNEQPPWLGGPLSPEERWRKMYGTMLAEAAALAAFRVEEMRREQGAARQRWLRLACIRQKFRHDCIPDWPVWKEPSDLLCPVCKSGNFTPTYHPRTNESAIGCCDCATAWILPNQPQPTAGDVERRKLEIAGLKFHLEHEVLLTPGESEMLLQQYGFDLINRVVRSNPFSHAY